METGKAETFASKIDFSLWNILNSSHLNIRIITTREESSTTDYISSSKPVEDFVYVSSYKIMSQYYHCWMFIMHSFLEGFLKIQ